MINKWNLFVAFIVTSGSVSAWRGYDYDFGPPHKYHQYHHNSGPSPHSNDWNDRPPCHDGDNFEPWNDSNESGSWEWGSQESNHPRPHPPPGRPHPSQPWPSRPQPAWPQPSRPQPPLPQPLRPNPTPPRPTTTTRRAVTSTTTMRVTTARVQGSSTKSPAIENCLRNCPTTSEFNPVCGTNGVTYTNPGRLECARICGIAVQLARNSQCPNNQGTTTVRPSSSTSRTTSQRPSTPSAQVIRTCLLNCPTTAEYNPVCGTNGVTYTNPSRLECARMCGVNVQVSRNSRCPENGGSSTSTQNTVTPRTTTLPPVPPTRFTTITTGPTSSPFSDYTISKEVLDQIFTSEPDYSGLIDERYE